jgi:hypothetical protein
MKVIALPASGGALPSQLATLSILPEIPDIVFATSGGNLAAYIAMSCDFNINRMEVVLNSVSTDVFLETWWPSPFKFMPSFVAGYCRGSYYNHGRRYYNMFNDLFVPATIGRREIWTGTTNCKNAKSQIFCNRSQQDCKLKTKYYDPNEYCANTPIYLDYNIDKISKATLASCSIQSIVPPVELDGIMYSDGGATFASPLTPMSSILRKCKKVQITYVNCCDIEAVGSLCLNTMGSYIRDVTSRMVSSMTFSDRGTGIELVRKGNYANFHRIDFGCCSDILGDIENFRKGIDRSMLEIFPCDYLSIDYSNYCPKTAVNILYTDRRKFKCRLWYSGNRSFEEEYPDIRDNCKCTKYG